MTTFASFHCGHDFLAVEFVMLTTSFSAILVVNRRMATRFDPKTILWTLIKNSVAPKVVLVVEVVLVVKSNGLHFDEG